jgi:hypothetical protein
LQKRKGAVASALSFLVIAVTAAWRELSDEFAMAVRIRTVVFVPDERKLWPLGEEVADSVTWNRTATALAGP